MKADQVGVFLMSACYMIVNSLNAQSTETQVWPEADFHLQFPANFRILALTGLEQGVNYPFEEWYAGAGLGYQFKPILKSHIENIDPDKEHHLVVAGGYEYHQTLQSGKVKREHRGLIEIVPGFRPLSWLLLRDRNRVEFRWINGVYSTRYRNEMTIEADVVLNKYHFTPFGAAEAFYDGSSHSWAEEWYTGGVEWPFKRLVMVETYYRREDCPTCNPSRWNVGGATLHFYFRTPK
jgi:Protein of unknown function (DUF2490)